MSMDSNALQPGVGAKTTADPWFYRYDPEEVSATTDQVNPETTFLKDFTSQLLSRESLLDGPRLFHDKLATPLQELSYEDTTLVRALSVQNPLDNLPTPHELTTMKMVYFSKFHPQCPYLAEVPAETLEVQSENLSIAIASLGSCIACSTRHVSLGKQANRTITVAAGMPNNRATRDPRSFIASLITWPNKWLLNETAAVMSSDAGLWREANFTHGFFETAVRRWWKVRGEMDFRTHRGPGYLTSIPAYALLIDVVRALHFDVVSTAAWALRDIPIDKQGQCSMGSMQTATFGQSSSDSGPTQQNDPLLTLLLILNQIIIWAVVSPPMEHWRHALVASHQKITTLTVDDECKRTRQKIEQALKAWTEAHLATSSHEVRALYYFAQLHLLVPHLQSLVVQARYKPRCLHENRGSESMGPKGQTYHVSVGSVQALHFAWLLLHSVAATQDKTFVWLPITTFITGLCIWRCLEQQGTSRLHGQVGVLRIVASELERMPWPCCKSMIECLENLL